VTAEYVRTEVQLQQALDSARNRLPAYGELLDFYGAIFKAQETFKRKATLHPVTLDPESVSMKLKNGFPLIGRADFSLDTEAAGDLFSALIAIAKDSTGKWGAFARSLQRGTETDPLEPERLFQRFLSGDDAFFAEKAKAFGVDVRMLGGFVYNSLLPFFKLTAEALSKHLKKEFLWEKGYCTVCGSLPGLAVFEAEGSRAFFCAFCFHQWPTRRLYCPYCENTESTSLHYFYGEGETGYRVDVCDRCGKYIKTLDLRAISHPLFPPLEILTTLHLDMKAQEAGYESAVSPLME